MRVKRVAGRDQFLPYFIRIVDLAVINDRIFAKSHRLGASFGVNYRKAPVNQRDIRLCKISVSVRSAHFQALAYAFDQVSSFP